MSEAKRLGHVGSGRSGANRSTAVMQRRRHSAPDALDYFPTPPFATRALCEWLAAKLAPIELETLSVWEPACGELHMVKPLREYFASVRASDVHRYVPDHELLDFLLFGAREEAADFIISNPPFKLAEQFINVALRNARVGVAMLLRSAFLEGQERHEALFSRLPPSFVLQFVERVAMFEGRLVRAGDVDPFAEKEGTKVSSATAYSWLIWLRPSDGCEPNGDTRLRWIPPCRARLERIGDYPNYMPEQLPPPSDGLFGDNSTEALRRSTDGSVAA